MHRSSSDIVANDRARWLADLAFAIEEAQQLAWRVGVTGDGSTEAMDLYSRLELARAEVEYFRLSGWASKREEMPPEWLDLLPVDRTTPALEL